MKPTAIILLTRLVFDLTNVVMEIRMDGRLVPLVIHHVEDAFHQFCIKKHIDQRTTCTFYNRLGYFCQRRPKL